jgi:predicted DNA-binding protein
MSGRKVATTIYITAEQDRQLKLLSQKTGVPMAQYIRDGIDHVLEENKAQLPQQIGLFGDEAGA